MAKIDIKRAGGTTGKRLPDQDARDRIAQDLGSNVMVEAAAGTGKTRSMVDRMIALIATGACGGPGNIAAVTFTRKAAAELRSRLRVGLEKAARSAAPGSPERGRLEAALAHVEQCFCGTIHSFCARLLRERPVEAGVGIGFEEMDEEEDMRLREVAWEEFVAREIAGEGGAGGAARELEAAGLTLGELKQAFLSFATYPDIEEWPGSAARWREPDLSGIRAAVRAYAAHMAKVASRFTGGVGNDKLIPAFKIAGPMGGRPNVQTSLRALWRLLVQMDKRGKVVQEVWVEYGFTGARALEEEDRWNDFRAEQVVPALDAIRERRYGPVMRALAAARDVYDGRRRALGRLNYQDLLMGAAALLRDNPHVRDYFARRYTHVLVDEFQDTDPVQAQVLLFLGARDPRETDWRRCAPRPGSLFLVGDPKQSIYRFRRADISTYAGVKRIVLGGGAARGSLLTLTSNFRSTPAVVDWVNGVFAPDAKGDGTGRTPAGRQARFPTGESDWSPAYVPLKDSGVYGELAAARGGKTAGVFTLTTPPAPGKNQKEERVKIDAELVARTIGWMTAPNGKFKIPLPEKHGEAAKMGPVRFGDILVLTKARDMLAVYAGWLQALGIPHQVTGGSALNNVEELALLHACLRAVTRPDDPVALVAVLRGGLFGVSDAKLYSFKKAGGAFSYRAPLPSGLERGAAAEIGDAFAALRCFAGWMASLPPLAAVERIVGDLGLMARAAARPGGEADAGALAKAVELMRAARAEQWSAAGLVEYLGGLVAVDEKHDGVPARTRGEDVVRVMNLHKAKGLEAPVVFLACPYGESEHPVEIRVDRTGGGASTGHLAVYGEKAGEYGPAPLLAMPPGWQKLAEEEKRFAEAEALRLRYVAATRAGSVLVISRGSGDVKWNPWQDFLGQVERGRELVEKALAYDPPKAKKGRPVGSGEVEAALARIGERWAAMTRPTYAIVRAKEHALAAVGAAATVVRGRGGDVEEEEEAAEGAGGAMEWGRVVHALLEKAAGKRDADLDAAAARLLEDAGLDAGLATVAADAARRVFGSELWRRAAASGKMLAEVPFTMPVERAACEGVVETVARGVIDLVFREGDGWVVVDYKTDAVKGKGAVDAAAAKYAPQVRLYARAWERGTGEKVKEAWLLFTGPGALVPVAREGKGYRWEAAT